MLDKILQLTEHRLHGSSHYPTTQGGRELLTDILTLRTPLFEAGTFLSDPFGLLDDVSSFLSYHDHHHHHHHHRHHRHRHNALLGCIGFRAIKGFLGPEDQSRLVDAIGSTPDKQ